MMKKLLKALLKLLNEYSVTIFCKIHFRNEARNCCRTSGIRKIDRKYSKEIRKYWKQYGINTPTVFHRWYTGINGIKDVKYIPEDLFYDKIIRYFNNMDLAEAYCDKGMYAKLFPTVKQPETIVLNINGAFYDEKYNLISFNEACNRLLTVDRFVIKPTRDSGGGKGVQFIQSQLDKQAVVNLVKQYNKDFIVQLPLTQHEALASVHKESINTIRVMSLMINGEVEIVSSEIRMGVGGSKLDNGCSGGICCGLDSNGLFSKYAYGRSGEKYDIHPQGFEFEKGYVPSYDKIIELVKREHKNLPYFGIVAWDWAVDKVGEPVMIEINLRWCGIKFHQLHHGGLFGQRTDEVLHLILDKGNQKGENCG